MIDRDRSYQRPKTHSPILWHFTGGPGWNEETKSQGVRPKAAGRAYEILISILRSRNIRVGTTREKLIARLPQKSEKARSGSYRISQTWVETDPVCCVADIPLSELFFHSQKYGKFAIGFHREDLCKAGFNPVFYIEEEGMLAKQIQDISSSTVAAQTFSKMVVKKTKRPSDLLSLTPERLEDALKNYFVLRSFFKSYPIARFEEFYGEREWRAIKPFDFSIDRVAMVLMPRKYLDRFIDKEVEKLGIPRQVPVAAWEDVAG